MTRIAIIGAHGKVGQQLMRLLYDRGDDFVGIVRSTEHAEDVYRLGGQGVVVDIESATIDQLAAAITGCDAVVFTAGAGAGSGSERKQTVDYGGSVLAAAAAQSAGIRRFVQVSAWGVDQPVAADADPTWAAYVSAKRDADAALVRSTLDWTILRPGRLSSEDGTGRVTLGDAVERGSIAREDVARLIIAALLEPRTVGHTWEAVGGDTPIEHAIAELVDTTIDWRALQRAAHRTFAIQIASVTDWSAPTPDELWNVRDLVAHVIDEQRWAPLLLAGRTAGEARARLQPLGDDLAAEWASSSAAATESWEHVDLDTPVRLSPDTVPARQYLSEQVADVVVHSWDLARAIGSDDRLDTALVEAAWTVFEPQKDTLEASGLFASAVPIAEGASLQSRLLALTGRDDRNAIG